MHHEQTARAQTAFLKDVTDQRNRRLQNLFEEENQDLLVFDTKEIMPSWVVDTLRHTLKVGQLQFDNFVI